MNRAVEWMIKERGVKYFYHFTPFANLGNIRALGIIPKKDVKVALWGGKSVLLFPRMIKD